MVGVLNQFFFVTPALREGKKRKKENLAVPHIFD
jgi:hypothetical protein